MPSAVWRSNARPVRRRSGIARVCKSGWLISARIRTILGPEGPIGRRDSARPCWRHSPRNRQSVRAPERTPKVCAPRRDEAASDWSRTIPSAWAPAIGAQLASYRIIRERGRGGMGLVYETEHVRLGRKAALKVLDPSLASDETFRARFVEESRLVAAIEHPNIIPIYRSEERRVGTACISREAA